MIKTDWLKYCGNTPYVYNDLSNRTYGWNTWDAVQELYDRGDLTFKAAETIEKIEAKWQKTPVDSGIAPLIFPEEEYNGLELTEYIPNTEGFWFYKNRNDALYSYNFSFAFFK